MRQNALPHEPPNPSSPRTTQVPHTWTAPVILEAVGCGKDLRRGEEEQAPRGAPGPQFPSDVELWSLSLLSVPIQDVPPTCFTYVPRPRTTVTTPALRSSATADRTVGRLTV